MTLLRKHLDFVDRAASPSSPASGSVRPFAKGGRFFKKDSSGVESELGARPVRTKTLSVDFAASSALAVTFLEDTFTPISTEVDIIVNLNATNEGFGAADIVLLYGIGNYVGSTMQQSGLYNPPLSGVTKVSVGRVTYDSVGTVSRRVRLTGLTPGSVYTWRLQVGTVGGQGRLSAGNEPQSITFSPDGEVTLVAGWSSDAVFIFPFPYQWYASLARMANINAVYPRPIAAPFPFHVSITPDGTKAITANYYASSATIISLTTGAVLGTVALASNPIFTLCTSNTVAFVSMGNGNLAEINLSTYALTANRTIVASGDLRGLATDGTYVYVAVLNQNAIYRYTISNQAVTSLSMGASTSPVECAVTPDLSALWVACSGTNAGVKRVALPGFASVSDTIASQPLGQTTATQAQSIAIGPDGNSVLVGWNAGIFSYFGIGLAGKIHSWVDAMAAFASATSAVRVAAHPKTGSIAMVGSAETVGVSNVCIFPGANFRIKPTAGGAFMNEWCNVDVVGAT